MHFRDSEEQFAEGLEFVARDEQVIGGAHAIPCLFGWFQFRRGLRERVTSLVVSFRQRSSRTMP